MSQVLTVRPLTREAFAAYGDVIEAGTETQSKAYAVNDGRAMRFHDLAGVDMTGGRTVLSIFRSEPVQLPFVVRGMERHPEGTQAFVPMHQMPFLVVVAPGGNAPEPPVAFLTNGRQGVNFRRGTWHHSLLPLHGGDFLVMDRDAPDENCDEAAYEREYVIAAIT